MRAGCRLAHHPRHRGCDLEYPAKLTAGPGIDHRVRGGRHGGVAPPETVRIEKGHLPDQVAAPEGGNGLACLAHRRVALSDDHELVAAVPSVTSTRPAGTWSGVR